MEFERFSFIVRFRMEAGDIHKHWNSLFSFFSPAEVSGCRLYYRTDDSLASFPEKNYVLSISGLSVGKARELLFRFKSEFTKFEDLCFISPFPQHNDFRDEPVFDCLGSVDKKGFVSGDSGRIGQMRFTGTFSTLLKKKKAVVLIPSDYVLGARHMNAFRERFPDHAPIVYPEMDDPKTNYLRIALDNNGVYCHTSDGYPYFRMFDDRIIFPYENEEEAKATVSAVMNKGFCSFLCISDDSEIDFSFDNAQIEMLSSKKLFKRYFVNSRLYKEIRNADLICCRESMEPLFTDACVKKERIVRL